MTSARLVNIYGIREARGYVQKFLQISLNDRIPSSQGRRHIETTNRTMSALNIFSTTFNLATNAAALSDAELQQWLAPVWNGPDEAKADIVVISIQEMSPLHQSSTARLELIHSLKLISFFLFCFSVRSISLLGRQAQLSIPANSQRFFLLCQLLSSGSQLAMFHRSVGVY